MTSQLQLASARARVEIRAADSLVSGDTARDDRNLNLLLTTIGDLYRSATLNDLLRTIVDRAILLAGGGRGALLLTGPDGALEAAVARSAEGGDLTAEQVLTRAVPREALRSGRVVMITDSDAPEQRDHASPSMLAADLRAVLCVPLPGPDGYAGVLYVDARQPASAFGRAELAVFEAMAVQAAPRCATSASRGRARLSRPRRCPAPSCPVCPCIKPARTPRGASSGPTWRTCCGAPVAL